jgi:hypothetical protein
MRAFLFKACRQEKHTRCVAVLGSDVDELDGKAYEFGDPAHCTCPCHDAPSDEEMEQIMWTRTDGHRSAR